MRFLIFIIVIICIVYSDEKNESKSISSTTITLPDSVFNEVVKVCFYLGQTNREILSLNTELKNDNITVPLKALKEKLLINSLNTKETYVKRLNLLSTKYNLSKTIVPEIIQFEYK